MDDNGKATGGIALDAPTAGTTIDDVPYTGGHMAGGPRRVYRPYIEVCPEDLFDNLSVDERERLRSAGVTPSDWADYLVGSFIDGLDDEFDCWFDSVLCDVDYEVDGCVDWKGWAWTTRWS